MHNKIIHKIEIRFGIITVEITGNYMWATDTNILQVAHGVHTQFSRKRPQISQMMSKFNISKRGQKKRKKIVLIVNEMGGVSISHHKEMMVMGRLRVPKECNGVWCGWMGFCLAMAEMWGDQATPFLPNLFMWVLE